jgi:carbonic anhydrase
MPLNRLKEGNAKFVKAIANDADVSLPLRKELAEKGQRPYAIIVTCADSRVPPEHIFNAGLGDLFVIRTAGNVVGEYERASVEYAVAHLGTRLVVVMGHTHCGAVNAALLAGRYVHAEPLNAPLSSLTAPKGKAPDRSHTHESEPESLAALVNDIVTAIGSECNELNAIKLNTVNSVTKLSESIKLNALRRKGDLKIVTALYDVATGTVDFFE